MTTFFTSDWHLGDSKLDKLGRPYRDTNEMAYAIAKVYDKYITKDDLVYIVGDVVREPSWPAWRSWLNARPGKKILIRGNHDRQITDSEFEPYFEQIVVEGEGIETCIHLKNGEELPLWVTHYPTLAKVEYFNLVAHIHGQARIFKNMINVGIDANLLMPLSEQRIALLYDAICNVYDDDVFVSNHPANIAHDYRGVKGSYWPPKS